jgi:tyrosyl-DNA phosphodiesterase 2
MPINPSLRPHQVSVGALYLRAAGHGIIAGDFNCVLPEDDDLVRTNGLTDAWEELHPDDPGHTWGIYGEQSFAPNRLDKVALLNLNPSAMSILQTSELGICGGEISVDVAGSGSKAHFSDHLGLWCDVGWAEDRAQTERYGGSTKR